MSMHTPTIKGDPIKWFIALGFTSLLMLMGLAVFISLTQMSSTINNMTSVVNETNTKLSLANNMRDYIRIRGQILASMYLSDDFIERDELRLNLASYGLKYKEARDNIRMLNLSNREKYIFNQLTPLSIWAREANLASSESMLSDEDIHTVKEKFLFTS